jgi:histidine ammonia-lyase
VAALLVGERQAWVNGELTSSGNALEAAGLRPLVLGPKESLAIMNGTSGMVALTCLGFVRALRLARLSSALTAMVVEAMVGQHAHFDARLFAAKPHPGQTQCAAWIRGWLGVEDAAKPRGARIQERYSIRCAPHVIGVLLDVLQFCRGVLNTEINGASDNPLIDPDTGDVLHGGNFYGGHAALVADTLKAQVANVAELMERQLVLLNDPAQNGGLPENLVLVANGERTSHHGFKAMEITASALTAEALKLTMPASVFSRSTESHNQDKVSMGSLAALDLTHILDLAETVAAIHLMACTQAVELRGLSSVSDNVRGLADRLRAEVAATQEDRAMDRDIEAALSLIRADQLPL